MSVISISTLQDRVLFAPEIKPEVNACLQQAVACADDFERACGLLHKANKLDPEQLEVYTALYKFYFYRGHFDKAESVALEALMRAGRQCGLPDDWSQITPASTNWQVQAGPARAFLYSLKALAFIRLRKKDRTGALAVLDKLKALDPGDQVGGSVIMQLAEAT